MPHYTKDGVAQAFIDEGRRRGITPRGQVIAIATGLVESNLTVYANRKVPESMNLPHDAVGSDGMSVGALQQQVVMGNGWWWGDARTCMDPTSSVGLFYDRLVKLDYNNPSKSAGSFAQAIQRSSFPDRYDQRMGEAQAIYDRLTRGAPAPPPPPPPAPVTVTEPYGLPRGSNSGGYGGSGVRFPDWVYQLGDAFGVKPSTYPGHQESNRNEAGYAPNPQRLNRAIDWAGSVDAMTKFADYLATIPQHLEQVIWQNPKTMRSIEVAGGRHQPGYFASDLAGHRDHVHTRQSRSIPLPGGAAPAPAPAPQGWRGDPIWLPDVLRAAGLVCHVYPGAFERGHGDMGQIWGVMAHHTGSFGETPRGIAEHPTLGLASQLYLSRDGEYTLCGVGKAWHGGNGSWPGISDVNGTLIGIEAANDGGGSSTKPLVHRSSWSDAQYDAYTRGVAAILNKLGYGSDRVIGHKEWAGKSQGKWDPGQIDMNIFRADVKARLTTSTPGDDMALVPQEQWDRVFRELTQPHPSRSPLRHLDDTYRDTWAGFGLNADGHGHLERVKTLAELGHPDSLALLKEVASAKGNPKYPDRQDDADVAAKILHDIYSGPAPVMEPVGPSAPAAATYAPSAAEVANAVVAALPAPDTTQVDALYAEIARLREENARLTAAVPLPTTTFAVASSDESIGDLSAGVIDSVTKYVNKATQLKPQELEALDRAQDVLKLNGAKK